MDHIRSDYVPSFRSDLVLFQVLSVFQSKSINMAARFGQRAAPSSQSVVKLNKCVGHGKLI